MLTTFNEARENCRSSKLIYLIKCGVRENLLFHIMLKRSAVSSQEQILSTN